MKVELISITPMAEDLISVGYAKCTGKKKIPLENLRKWIALDHTSVLEHAVATFEIKGISRACLSQLTRHRIGCSYSVRSQRYNDVSNDEIIVPDLPEPWRQWYKDRVNSARDLYIDMVANGIPLEDARAVLPIATTTELIMTMNFRAARHFIELRSTEHAQAEIRLLARKILDILIDHAPHIFEDLSFNRQGKE